MVSTERVAGRLTVVSSVVVVVVVLVTGATRSSAQLGRKAMVPRAMTRMISVFIWMCLCVGWQGPAACVLSFTKPPHGCYFSSVVVVVVVFFSTLASGAAGALRTITLVAMNDLPCLV